MKQYKRIITVLSLGLILALGVTACNSKGDETTKQTDTTASSETTPSTTAPTPPQTEPPTEQNTESQSEDTSESQSETQEAGGESADGQSGSDSSKEERYFFDEKGNTIYTTENSDGNWVDKDGMVYTFLENGVKDSNGTKYYYDPPAYREGGSQTSDNSGEGTSDGSVVELYTKDGSLKKLKKNSDGVWADENGVTYELREDGAKDSNGTLHPW